MKHPKRLHILNSRKKPYQFELPQHRQITDQVSTLASPSRGYRGWLLFSKSSAMATSLTSRTSGRSCPFETVRAFFRLPPASMTSFGITDCFRSGLIVNVETRNGCVKIETEGVNHNPFGIHVVLRLIPTVADSPFVNPLAIYRPAVQIRRSQIWAGITLRSQYHIALSWLGGAVKRFVPPGGMQAKRLGPLQTC